MRIDPGYSGSALIAAYFTRIISAIGLALLVWSIGCDRQALAAKIPHSMIGMPKTYVLSCMGTPSNSTISGGTEVLSYHTGSVATNSNEQAGSNVVHIETLQSPICKIDITLTRGRVSNVQYNGLHGAPTMVAKQCAYAIENCLSERPGPAIYSVPQSPASARSTSAPLAQPFQQHTCTHDELVQARIAKMNGYTGTPNCN